MEWVLEMTVREGLPEEVTTRPGIRRVTRRDCKSSWRRNSTAKAQGWVPTWRIPGRGRSQEGCNKRKGGGKAHEVREGGCTQDLNTNTSTIKERNRIYKEE